MTLSRTSGGTYDGTYNILSYVTLRGNYSDGTPDWAEMGEYYGFFPLELYIYQSVHYNDGYFGTTLPYDLPTVLSSEINWVAYANMGKNLDSSYNVSISETNVTTAVPEPGILILLGISMVSVAGLRKWWKD